MSGCYTGPAADDTDGGYPTVAADAIPWVSAEQMRRADGLAMGPFGIDLLQMMEHAGAALADVVLSLGPDGPVTVLAGAGNNGGGGLCAARHLANRGRDIEVVVATEQRGEAVEHHLATLGQMGVAPRRDPSENPIVIDAMVGYGLHGPLSGRAAALAAWASERFAVSLDYPSGLGFPGSVRSAATLTLALPKEGLEEVSGLFVADLGLPDRLWQELGVEAEGVFSAGPVLQIV